MATSPVGLTPALLDAAVDLMGRAGRGGTVRVRGVSMLPTLVEGQVLAVEFSTDRPLRGDLLLYRQADYLVVHRLLGPARRRPGRPRLRTRGDGQQTLDPALDRERILGRVIAVHGADAWRSLRGRPARAYAWALAWHDLAWAAAGILARRADRMLVGVGLPAPFARVTGALDRGLLALVHRGLFRLVHPRIPPPPEAGGAGTPH